MSVFVRKVFELVGFTLNWFVSVVFRLIATSACRFATFMALLLPVGVVFGEEVVVSFNGNFLFYNAPVMQTEPGHGLEYVGYVSRWGGVWVSTLDVRGERPSVLKRELVHDYHEDIDAERGYADDQAAPALILDVSGDRLLLATSYHGSDLFIYEKPLRSSAAFRLLDRIVGRYTYPRFFTIDDQIYLLARRQSEGVLDGDLVMRSARDGFVSETVVVESRKC